MTWKVILHPLVAKDDLPSLDASLRKRVLRAVRTKLASDPKSFGEPLRRELFGYRKLRVGDVRVIYSIRDAEVVVHVLKVGMRKDSEVYSEMLTRVKHLLIGEPASRYRAVRKRRG